METEMYDRITGYNPDLVIAGYNSDGKAVKLSTLLRYLTPELIDRMILDTAFRWKEEMFQSSEEEYYELLVNLAANSSLSLNEKTIRFVAEHNRICSYADWYVMIPPELWKTPFSSRFDIIVKFIRSTKE